MANYKISEAAKIDLIRIHQYGVIHFGEDQADKYYNAFFEQFEKIAKQPFLYPTVDFIRPGYRRCVLGVDSIYFLVKDGSVEIIRIIGRQDFAE
ncbi:type II toxin-antitoxin system RelE/ParE family toxin [Antarcticibacterium flavum]|uniref:Type II toxin-antitoxin system RelE/ParE family toxin n=1 Tax=Antarcticibacterium flavum TaxID=2058175 RepID=A0A5B7X551_9FLAO|nr:MULTISPECIES: type II toxin-antitoxin system RelE/ParE family toxin [Antarcticibacterium]MCM4161794.1 type II toxin-antitoxin system RelE/ParE family toxin [Antarcticibacterium sp. W02-3]QCY70604.1 type II toxin-antitoxin system RelE/ParE family toxin [Antarcticibacterium flavum]